MEYKSIHNWEFWMEIRENNVIISNIKPMDFTEHFDVTIEDIIKNHKVDVFGGKRTKILCGDFLISVVGGRNGLYGDFEKDFELAVIDTTNGNFVTRDMVSGLNDDVIGFLSPSELVKTINKIIGEKDFQIL